MEKPNTRFLACQVGCGNRVWSDKRVLCPECKARRAATAGLRLHGNSNRNEPEQYTAEKERRIKVLRQRAAAGLPLSAA